MQSAESCLDANDNCKKGNNRILNEYYCLYLPGLNDCSQKM